MTPSAAREKRDHGVFWATLLESIFRQFRDCAVFYADHQHHSDSTRVFLAAGKSDFCALRSLGEVYATLTGLPVRPRITGPEGMRVVKQVRERLTLISLSESQYVGALDAASETIVGGAAYDAIIAGCAIKAGAAVLVTWNVRDFTRLGSEIAAMVRTPLDR